MTQRHPAATWKKLFVHLAGRTNSAHGEFVSKLKAIGHVEVSSPEQSDYLLLFCPITSRVGTDISEALEITPGGKPIILVVMHHTFNKDLVIAESRRQVSNRNVVLTVDYLFHEGKPLRCNRNDIAWDEVQSFFPRSRASLWRRGFSCLYSVSMLFLLFVARLLIKATCFPFIVVRGIWRMFRRCKKEDDDGEVKRENSPGSVW